MRQLIVADLHYSLRQWDWLVRAAEHFDGVIIAGDLLDLASTVDLDAQAIVVLKYLERLAPRLLVTSGNHDLDDLNALDERTAAWLVRARATGALVDGDTCELDGWRFTLCPWWEGDRSREAVEDQLRRDAALPRRRWVWIHHAPPQGARVSWTGKHDGGDPVLTGWIQQYAPDVVLSGHIHQAPFKPEGSWADRIGRTWVFNAGAYPTTEPPFTILDLDQQSIEWISAAGRETIQLNVDVP